MATSPISAEVPVQLYPFSTQDGQSIPNDIIRPTFLVKSTVLASDFKTITISDLESMIVAYSTQMMTIGFTGGYVADDFENDELYLNTVLIPPHTPTVFQPISLEMKARVLQFDPADEVAPGTTGTLILQGFVKWAALGLPRQAAKR